MQSVAAKMAFRKHFPTESQVCQNGIAWTPQEFVEADGLFSVIRAGTCSSWLTIREVVHYNTVATIETMIQHTIHALDFSGFRVATLFIKKTYSKERRPDIVNGQKQF